MSLPQNTGQILIFLHNISTDPDYYFIVRIISATGLPEITYWNTVELGTQPTEQEIIDAGNDLTTVNGQVFSEWLAEHGGDPILTLRREAQEALDAQNSRIEALIRAFALVMVDEINLLRTEHSLADRTAAQLRTAIKNKIAAGEADT